LLDYNQEDIEAYFTGGACTAFAFVLQSKFPEYKFGILYDDSYEGLEYGPPIFHVFCHTNDLSKSIDVCKIRDIQKMVTSFNPQKPRIEYNIPKEEILSQMGEGKSLAEIGSFFYTLAEEIITRDRFGYMV